MPSKTSSRLLDMATDMAMMAPPKGDPSSDVLGCFSRASQPTTTDTKLAESSLYAIGGVQLLSILGVHPIDTLWWTYKKQLNMAIEIVGFPIKNGDFP